MAHSVSSILDILKYGNFRSIAASQEGLGFSNADVPILINFINSVVRQIYTEYHLGFTHVEVNFQANTLSYDINKANAVSQDASAGFIDDSLDRQLMTVSKLLYATVAPEIDCTLTLPINNTDRVYQVLSNYPNKIRITQELLDDFSSMLLYLEMLPKRITLTTDACVLDEELEIPDVFLELLVLGVAKLYYASSGSKENAQKAMLFTQMYEQEAALLQSSGSLPDTLYFMPSEDMGEWP